MRPILYNANETAFETYGLGEIDATKAQVTRERNGNYTLYIEYPASGPLAGTFKNDMRIKSDAGLRTKNQTFFISRIAKDSSGILKVYAKHISHLTEKMAIRNNTNATGTAQAALAIWASNCLGGIRFDVWSDIELSSKTSWDIANFKTARDALGGVSGSILDVWGGEYEFDNTTIRLHKQLGRKSPIVLEYGRNILRAEDDQDIESAYTSVYPYATYTPETQGSGDVTGSTQQVTVELPEKYVDGPYIGLYNERRVLIVDFSSNFKEKEVPTVDKLRKLAKDYAINNRLGLPKINTKIEYVDLSKTLDYKLTQILEEAELCDIVPVYYPEIGLTSEDAKLTTIVYDVLLEQNDSVEVGVIGDGFKSSMTSNLSSKIDDIAGNHQRLVNTLPDYLLNAQGNKVWYNRPDNSEHKVGDIWFEKNGLYNRMYIWNGSMWEKRIDTEDVDKVKKEVEKKLEDSKKSTDLEIAKVAQKAQDALTKAGTLPDASKLSDQVKTLILNSPDLTQKVTNTFTERINGTEIYNKISGEVEKKFITIDATDSRFRQVSEQVDRKVNDAVSGVNERVSQTNRMITRVNSDVMQAKTDISNTRLYVRDANEKIDKANQKISDVDGRVDRTDQSIIVTNGRINDTNQAVNQTNDRVDQTNRDLANTNAQVEANKRQIEVQVTNFNAVRESTKLFERILGTTEEGAPDKLSRLVMSSQIFQTEVGKYSTTGGPNMIRNSRADDNFRYWEGKNLERWDHDFYFKGQKHMFMLKQVSWMRSPRFLLKRNTGYMLNFLGFNSGNTKRLKIVIRMRKKGETQDHTFEKVLFDETTYPILGSSKASKRSIKFDTGDFDEGFLFINNEGPNNGADKWSGVFLTEFDLYEGTSDRLWQPAPEDATLKVDKTVEATRTQVTQLAGSWAVRNLTNSGDVLNSINLLANGTNRIDGRLTHITGQTIIDNAVIKDGMIASVSANKVTAGTIDARDVNLINLNASSVTSGTFKGLTFEGGIIRGNNGNTEINLNSNITTYNGTAKIEFKSPGNSLEFNSGGRKAFLAPTVAQYTNYAAFALGVNDRGEHDPNRNYVGLKIFNQPNSRQVEIIGDLMLTSYYNQGIKTTSLRDLFKLIDDNFKKLREFRVAHGEGSPGFWDIGLS